MTLSSVRGIREILVFAGIVAILGLLLTLASQGLGSLVDSRNAEVLSGLAKADSVRILPVRAAYPRFGRGSVYSLDTPSGPQYGTLIELSIPGGSGLFAAIFSTDGELLSLVDLTTDEQGSHGPGYPSLSLFPGSILRDSGMAGPNPLNPANYELSQSLSAASSAILTSLKKASKP